MSSDSIFVRKLTEPTPQELEKVNRILQTALNGDMCTAALTGGRASLEPSLYDVQIQLSLQEGEIYVAGHGGRIEGVLLAFPPGKDIEKDDGYQWATLDDYVGNLTTDMQQWWHHHLRPKYNELTRIAMGSAEARRTAWYVRLVAVLPEHQRRGVGRKLMENVIEKAMSSKNKLCLEVQNDQLVRFFYRFRFGVRATKNFSSYQGGFPLFMMVREPS